MMCGDVVNEQGEGLGMCGNERMCVARIRCGESGRGKEGKSGVWCESKSERMSKLTLIFIHSFICRICGGDIWIYYLKR